jgi:phosphohistidine phosphatase
MKTLLIMRHAKSDWSYDDLSDFDRPLNERGKDAAPKVGKELKKLGITPDLIISSPANRAKTTAILFSENNDYKNEIVFSEDFYFGHYSDIAEIIKNTDEKISTLMIIGHNPIWEKITTYLSEKEVYIEMQTATVYIMVANIEKWKDIDRGTFEIKTIIRPKDIK